MDPDEKKILEAALSAYKRRLAANEKELEYLQEENENLEQAIDATEQLLDLTNKLRSPDELKLFSQPESEPTDWKPSKNEFAKASIVSAAVIILEKTKMFKTTNEIIELLKSGGYLFQNPAKIYASVYKTLTRAAKGGKLLKQNAKWGLPDSKKQNPDS